jgi:hypothetical protein
MKDGRLPPARGQVPAKAARALRVYYRAYCDPRSTSDGRRRSAATLRMYLETMDAFELSHYYAGVRRLLVPLGECGVNDGHDDRHDDAAKSEPSGD